MSTDDRPSRPTPSRAPFRQPHRPTCREACRADGAPAVRAVTPVVGTFPDRGTADLTARQRRILDFIRDWVERYGYPPSVREIGEAVGLVSPSSVAYQLKALERKGFLRRDPNRPRAVDVRPPSELVDDEASRAAAPRPGLRTVARPDRRRRPDPRRAGRGGRLPLPRELVGEGEVFMLQVKGDSMREAAICDGDWVVVRRQPTANWGRSSPRCSTARRR